MNDNLNENIFIDAVEIISRKAKREIVFSFLINENVLVFCLSKFHKMIDDSKIKIDENIILDQWIDNFDNNFINFLSKEICE